MQPSWREIGTGVAAQHYSEMQDRGGCTLAIVTASSPTLEAFYVEMSAHTTVSDCSQDMRHRIPEWICGPDRSLFDVAMDAGVAGVVALVSTES
jgi:hypothetical protein